MAKKPLKTKGKPNSKKKGKRLSDFRFFKLKDRNDKENHPNYIFKKEGSKLSFLKITHDKKANRSKYKDLDGNPDPKDNRPAYISKKAETKEERLFSTREKGWKFSRDDQKKVNEIIKQNEKKQKK